MQFVMGVKNAMPVDKPTFDFYVETVKRLAPDASWCGAGIGPSQILLNEWCDRGRRPHPDRARGQPAARPRHAGAVERGAGRADGRALRQARPPGGDAGRGARDPRAPGGMISPFDGAITAGLYGDPRWRPSSPPRPRSRAMLAGRGRARPGRGRARHHPGGERPGDRARGRARSRSTPRRSPPAWPRPGCRWRRWSPPSGASSGRTAAVAALGRHQPGRRRHRAGAAAARGARGARRPPGAADRGARGAGASGTGPR